MDVELSYRTWLNKITEKLTFISLKVKERSELTEADYELMRILYSKIWRPGEFAIFTHENITIKPDETAVQQGLFSQNGITVTSLPSGTEVDYFVQQTKTEKNE